MAQKKFLRFVPAALGVSTAAIDEMVIQQFLVSERTAAVTDVLLDSIGFYAALIIIFVVSFAVIIFKLFRRRMLT
ncbi:VanZ family protein [[Clostridium] cellulosi]